MGVPENAKVPCIPPQHHLGLLPGLGRACTNSIENDKKRDDIQCLTSVNLGPLLWNIILGDILKMDIPQGVNIIRYTDNTLLVTAEDNIHMLQWKVTLLLRQSPVGSSQPSDVDF